LEQQRTGLQTLQTTVTTLQEQLAAARKDSSTSSKPPSSDIVKPPPPPPAAGQSQRQRGASRVIPSMNAPCSLPSRWSIFSSTPWTAARAVAARFASTA